LRALQSLKLLGSSEREYADAVLALRPCYEALKLSKSDATVVVNAKAFYHLMPDFIPPIDRQYTIRFFRQRSEDWQAHGKFKVITLPAGIDAQFNLFHATCVAVKRLADRIDPAFFETELHENHVTPPKAVDNAIVNYIRIISAQVFQPGHPIAEPPSPI
jgi:hypothetical protein